MFLNGVGALVAVDVSPMPRALVAQLVPMIAFCCASLRGIVLAFTPPLRRRTTT